VCNTQDVNGREAKPSNEELYIVTEDCAPSTEGEGILYMKCGQVYEVISKISDWWKARLVVDMANPDLVGQEGWVAPSFLNRYTGNLQEQLKQQQERLQEQQQSQEQLRVQEQQRLNQLSQFSKCVIFFPQRIYVFLYFICKDNDQLVMLQCLVTTGIVHTGM